MAYGNWGGNVFRNGERMREWEDATPYKETEFLAGYHQAFLRDEGCNPHHAVLGEKDVRLCGYKSYPVLFVKGEKVDLSPFTTRDDNYTSDGEGEIEGYRFSWETGDDPAMVSLELIEPDGTAWSGFSGYAVGAGYDD